MLTLCPLPDLYHPLKENPAGIELPVNAVHVWHAAWKGDDETSRVLWDILDEAERQRALRLRSDGDRKRFISTHGMFRIILSRYLGLEPDRIAFSFNQFGKPCLASESQMEFSMTHSGDLALFAFTTAGRIGVDVERILPLDDLDELEGRYLSKAERNVCANRPPLERLDAFYRFWTLKEAYLKMLGRGLTGDLDALNMVPAWRGEDRSWSADVFSPMSGYLAALAADTEIGTVVRFGCDPRDFIN